MHLLTFLPGPKLPIADEVLEGVSPFGLTLGSYQFNLKGQLVPVSFDLYTKQSILAPLPFRIEDNKGNLLAHVQFTHWQDGGVIRLIGKLPLEGLLVFLGRDARNAQIIRQSGGAVSNVLPISEAEFRHMLATFQRRSNMKVRAEKPGWTMSKFSDEGTSSPFMARLFMGILDLRNAVFEGNKNREEFDILYQFVVETLINARAACKELMNILAEHNRKVSQGEIARVTGYGIRIDESIDGKLRKQADEFLGSSVRVLKDGMQKLVSLLDVDIGFLFKKQGAFDNGIAALAKTRAELAAYLQETRKWSERLISNRNNLHEGWMLPRTRYKTVGNIVQVVEPEISGQPVSVFVDNMLDRLLCFVEEVAAYALQNRMPSGISITEIPITDRKADLQKRFQITFVNGGMPIWTIAYHTGRFDDT